MGYLEWVREREREQERGREQRANTDCEKSEKSEKSPLGEGGTPHPNLVPHPSVETAAPYPSPHSCPRCAALDGLDAQVDEVLAELRRHPALPPALRALPDERLRILLKWTIITLSNPRPVWPPPPIPDKAKRHRRPLELLVADLGGKALGGTGTDTDHVDAQGWGQDAD